MILKSLQILNLNRTICALSSSPGIGALHLIRLSGLDSVSIAKKMAPFLPENIESHKAYFAKLRDPINFEILDEVVLTFFLNGKSFTGEDLVEISCHGNPLISNEILKMCVVLGASIANKGEFSFRAFINGKLDLVQAESVYALIESRSKNSKKIALSQLSGGLSSEIKKIEELIIEILSDLEASIDFSAEDIEIISFEEMNVKIAELKSQILQLVNSYGKGKKISSSFQVVIAGRPNGGKSSLLNTLLNEERAIVSSIPGTTRDVIQESIEIDGAQILLKDTAGIRDTNDEIENIGIQKSKTAITNADLILLLIDATNDDFQDQINQFFSQIWSSERTSELIPQEKILLVVNKMDLVNKESIEKLMNSAIECSQWDKSQVIYISALDQGCTQIIKNEISNRLKPGELGDLPMVSNLRHFELLQNALKSLDEAYQQILIKNSLEFISLDIKRALLSIQEILGISYDDQILDRIFSKFCLGK